MCFSWCSLAAATRDDKQVVSIQAVGFAAVTVMQPDPIHFCECQFT